MYFFGFLKDEFNKNKNNYLFISGSEVSVICECGG
jgi:hypothetical protein